MKDPLGIAHLSATEVLRRFAARDLSPVELTNVALSRIERLEPSLNAFQIIDADGARRAAEMSARRWLRGEPIGPLDGVPLRGAGPGGTPTGESPGGRRSTSRGSARAIPAGCRQARSRPLGPSHERPRRRRRGFLGFFPRPLEGPASRTPCYLRSRSDSDGCRESNTPGGNTPHV